MPVITTITGQLHIIRIIGPDPNKTKLAKCLFEASRDGSDMLTHFDPTLHTLRAIERGLPGHVPLQYRECNEEDLPAERALRGVVPTFRDAWEDSGAIVAVNMPQARGIHMDRIRAVRDAELVKLDLAYLRALEIGGSAGRSEAQRVVERKQLLRDIPQTFDLSTPSDSPEELRVMWPSILPLQGH